MRYNNENEQTLGTCNTMDGLSRNTTEWKDMSTEVWALYDSIYTKFKRRLNSSEKVEAGFVITGDVPGAWKGPGVECGVLLIYASWSGCRWYGRWPCENPSRTFLCAFCTSMNCVHKKNHICNINGEKYLPYNIHLKKCHNLTLWIQVGKSNTCPGREHRKW